MVDTEQLTDAAGFAQWTGGMSAVAFETMANLAAERHSHVAELLEWTGGLGDAAASGEHGSAVLVTASDVAADAVLGLAARHHHVYSADGTVPVVYLQGSMLVSQPLTQALGAFYGRTMPHGRGMPQLRQTAETMRQMGTSMLLIDGLDEVAEPGQMPTDLRALHDEVPLLVVAIRRTVDQPHRTEFGMVHRMAGFRVFMRHVDVRDIDPDDFR